MFLWFCYTYKSKNQFEIKIIEIFPEDIGSSGKFSIKEDVEIYISKLGDVVQMKWEMTEIEYILNPKIKKYNQAEWTTRHYT